MKIDSLVKSRKTVCLRECIVFSVYWYNNLIYRVKCYTKYQTRNTKHMMNSTFYEFIKIKMIVYLNYSLFNIHYSFWSYAISRARQL